MHRTSRLSLPRAVTINTDGLKRFGLPLMIVPVLTIGLAACSKTAPAYDDAYGEDPAAEQSSSTPISGAVISMAESASIYKFEPDDISVKVGDKVTWKNDGDIQHTASATAGQTVTFKSPVVPPGGTFEQTFSAPGKYSYYCSVHGADKMQGVIHVTP
jgi:plastocyanin